METELCRIFADEDGTVHAFVREGLNENIVPGVAMGIAYAGKLIGGIVFNDIRPERDCWLTIYTTDKRWCNRRVLRAIFGLVFDKMKCERCSAFVSKNNQASKNLVERLGFRPEGVIRLYADDGQDRLLYGMLKEECKYYVK